MTKVEWKSRAFFAEVAETIGVPTSMVMGAQKRGGDYDVLWSSEEDLGRATPVLTATLRRDAGGVLRFLTDPKEAGVAGDYLPPRP